MAGNHFGQNNIKTVLKLDKDELIDLLELLNYTSYYVQEDPDLAHRNKTEKVVFITKLCTEIDSVLDNLV